MCGSRNPHTVPLQGPTGIFNGPVGINCGVKTMPCASMVKSPCALGKPQVSQCEATSEEFSPSEHENMLGAVKSHRGGGDGSGGGSGNSGHIKSDSYDDPAVPRKETTSGSGSGDAEEGGADEVGEEMKLRCCAMQRCVVHTQCSAIVAHLRKH